ncbi:TPA: hypothetical protein N0F65_009422 [Lagenidium giganteum]|uniref:Drug/Metabolite Transporter (DMT) Superfamily n=1 Tax=Lagenidium giganteum TaxID=4803 RepID=A0AAV2ZDI3_9STRA|nr:TPA: hypothetical protein N0F65_009422 [Lagenidium giganteum]
MGFNTPFVSLGTDAWTGKPYHLCSKKSLLSFAVIIVLVLAMASERLMFKIMVDRMESYRYFLCQFMTFIYIPPLFCIVGYKATQDDFIEEEVTEFPKLRFFVMGILDLMHVRVCAIGLVDSGGILLTLYIAQAMLVFIPGGKTAPSLTVTLMQASVPLSACASILLFRTRYTGIQLLGIVAMLFGLVVALLPSFDDIVSDDFDERESGWNSIFYLLAAVPAAASMIYKERTIRDQPMDMVYLNAWVSVYQFIGGLMLAPLVFDVDVLHLEQKMSGLECLINGRNEVPTDKCHLGIAVLVAYVVCNVLINVLLLQVLKLTSISVMYGSALVGFFVSFVTLEAYQWDPLGFGGADHWLASSIYVDLLAFLSVFAGKILYHWDADPEVEATTTSAEDKEAASLLTDDDDYGMRYTRQSQSRLFEYHFVQMASTLKHAAPTVSRLAKAKKPLSDMHQLQRAVRELQREAADQLVLEVESQATFEFLTTQIKALKGAFATLSDVLMNELDGLRRDTTRQLHELDAQMTQQLEMHKATHSEVMQLKRTMEIWSLKERDWAKDNEILKASHAHNIEWMQQLQRDVMDVKDKLHEVKTDVSFRLTDLCEETNNLRGQWQKQVDDMTERLQAFDAVAHKQAMETRAQAQQRVDDLELMEQAITTVQKQQMQVRATFDEHTAASASHQSLMLKKLDALDAACSAQRSTIDQLRARSATMEKEQRRRMENISRMFAVFADALDISPSVFPLEAPA